MIDRSIDRFIQRLCPQIFSRLDAPRGGTHSASLLRFYVSTLGDHSTAAALKEKVSHGVKRAAVSSFNGIGEGSCFLEPRRHKSKRHETSGRAENSSTLAGETTFLHAQTSQSNVKIRSSCFAIAFFVLLFPRGLRSSLRDGSSFACHSREARRKMAFRFHF